MATGTPIIGQQSSQNMLAALQMPDYERVLFLLEPYQTPFTQWLFFGSKSGKEVINPQGAFSWFEDEFLGYTTTVASNFAGGATTGTLVVTSGSFINTNDELLLEGALSATPALCYVTAGAGTTSLTIAALDGATNLPACAAGTNVKVVGNFNKETEPLPTAIATVPVQKTNYIQILQRSVNMTGRAEMGKYWTDGMTFDEQVEKAIKEMKVMAERLLMMSPTGGYYVSGSDYYTYTKGLAGFITTHVSTYTGALQETDLDAHFQAVFSQGSKNKTHYAGWQQIRDISTIIKNHYQVIPDPVTTEYGVDLQSYTLPFGKVKLVPDPVMDGNFTGWGFTVDEEHVRLRFGGPDETGPRRFRVEENVKTPGTGGSESKILMDIGLEVSNQETCGILKQVG